jgi:mannose-6-phosphate isomerase-like protein (cupin superfamily)
MDTIAAPDLQQKLANRVARFADRREDWSVFGFETALDPKFARAQRRYLGASGSVDHGDLRGSIPATAFTMSIQSMPPGNQIPMHCHETEEIFFILDGEARVRCWENGESFDLTLGRWDLVALPSYSTRCSTKATRSAICRRCLPSRNRCARNTTTPRSWRCKPRKAEPPAAPHLADGGGAHT